MNTAGWHGSLLQEGVTSFLFSSFFSSVFSSSLFTSFTKPCPSFSSIFISSASSSSDSSSEEDSDSSFCCSSSSSSSCLLFLLRFTPLRLLIRGGAEPETDVSSVKLLTHTHTHTQPTHPHTHIHPNIHTPPPDVVEVRSMSQNPA